ncbi:hypothetical protein IFM89_029326 [Coptis chinensis]|uniref:DNA ligase ATP-dependent N-terminal domain-containing protein n=1 Tax=Coptis chinensis TaxID=261450 RepID=A0A835MA41_9MAGN|nr:hypothetical protein IFM89_029326 [Coptis chinensis]
MFTQFSVTFICETKPAERIGQGIIQLEKNPADFDTNSAAFWNEGESVLFFVSCPAVVYLSSNKIATFFSSVELCIGNFDLIKAVAKTYKISEKHIKEELGIRKPSLIKVKKCCDLGGFVKERCSSQLERFNYKPAPLTVVKVLNTFPTVANESGKDSQV